jgi:predicted PurR-regulated permease PerM
MDAASAPPEPLDERPLGRLLAPPRWLRDLGTSAWLIAGVALVTVAAIWLLSLTQTIVLPVITACVVAAVASPIVSWLRAHRIPRGVGAVLVVLGLVLVAVLVTAMVTGGILSQSDALRADLSAAQDRLAEGLTNLGVSPSEAQEARATASGAVKDAVPALLNGVVTSVGALSSVVVFLSLTALSLVFLLKDGPAIRSWAETHVALPVAVARMITGRVLQSLRGYFVGVTAVAVFNAVLVGVGALIFGVPLAGTIAIVTFLGAYVPYLGAWTAGIFTILVALGGVGVDAAIAMAVVCLLANGVLQQLIQPIAYGAALGIHPLAVLVVTIAGGSLFGGAGLILAAPLLSAVVRIAADVSTARTAGAQEAAAREAGDPVAA